MPFPRQGCILIQLIERTPVPQTFFVGDDEFVSVNIERNGIWREGLQFNGLRTGVCGFVDHCQRPFERMIVVS